MTLDETWVVSPLVCLPALSQEDLYFMDWIPGLGLKQPHYTNQDIF